MSKKSDKKLNNELKDEIEQSAKLFDVAKPGQTPADSTSRPIIVSHTPIIKHDPMVRKEKGESESGENESESKPAEIKNHTALTIQPPSETKPADDQSDDTTAEPVKSEKDEKPSKSTDTEAKADTKAEETDLVKEKQESDSEVQEISQASDDVPQTAAVDALAGEVSAKREEQKQKSELAAKVEEVEKSIVSKEFFVPIGEVSRRRSANRLAFLLFIVLLVICLNFALDAEVLEIGVEPLTNLL